MKERILDLLSKDPPPEITMRAISGNPFFTEPDIRYAWEAVRSWMPAIRHLPEIPVPARPARIGVVAAGNIPFAGLHDLICVLVFGHYPLFRPSSRDSVLMKWILEELSIQLVPELSSVRPDALIASGSSVTARQLESQFPSIPQLIRGHRYSIAILPADLTHREAELLGEDILRYNGFGCRSVSNLLAPSEAPVSRLMDTLKTIQWELSGAFRRLLDWERAILQVNGVSSDAALPVLVQYSAGIRPVAPGYVNVVLGDALIPEEEIQVIAGRSRPVGFGKTQHPGFLDFPDGRNVLDWLKSIGQESA